MARYAANTEVTLDGVETALAWLRAFEYSSGNPVGRLYAHEICAEVERLRATLRDAAGTMLSCATCSAWWVRAQEAGDG